MSDQAALKSWTGPSGVPVVHATKELRGKIWYGIFQPIDIGVSCPRIEKDHLEYACVRFADEILNLTERLGSDRSFRRPDFIKDERGNNYELVFEARVRDAKELLSELSPITNSLVDNFEATVKMNPNFVFSDKAIHVQVSRKVSPESI